MAGAQNTSTEGNEKLYQLKIELDSAISNANHLEIAQAQFKLGNFFSDLTLYGEATSHYQESLEFYPKKDSCLVYIKGKLASINLDLKKYDITKQYAQSSLDLSESLGYNKGKASANALLGSVAEKLSDYDEALKYQNSSLQLFLTLNDSTGIAKTNENIGSIYEDLEQYDLAYTFFKTAKLYAKNSPTDLQINILNNLGDVNRKTSNYTKALNYTEQAYKLAKETNNQHQLVSALKDFARTYASIGDFEKAYDYLSNQNIANEVEISQNNNEVVSALQVLYDVKEKEAKVELLNQQNQINKVQQYITLIITSIIILALILGLLYWKKRRKHEKHILEYQQQLLQADLDKKAAKEVALKREIDIKISSLTNYSLNIAHKNKMLYDISKTLTKLKGRNTELISNKLSSIVKDIETDLDNNNEWTELMSYFGQIHPSFFSTLKQKVSGKLSSSEMRLCMLLRLNLSSKEIADILHITPDSVRIARYRLRKKLPLNAKDDLQDYLLNL